MLKTILFYIVVLLSNIIQVITGFAGTVLAMPASVMLVGYETAKPVLNILGIVASVFVVATSFKSINKKEFIKITGITLLGIIAAVFVKDWFLNTNTSVLYKTLGIVVIVCALINMYFTYKKKERKDMPKILEYIVLVISGLIHGVFVCGGPLLVTYASVKMTDKDEFRSTLSAVWIVLNSVILIDDIRTGYFMPGNGNISVAAISIGVLLLAMLIGNLIYKKMSRKVFLNLSYVLIIISGISLLIK